MEYKWVGKPVSRIDAPDKVIGRTKYMTDLELPGMLWGKIVRASVPYAKIVNLDTGAAEKYPGVVAVVTYQDVPGSNGFGIAVSDQPVFCSDRVRYEGDAVAGVIAETRQIAEEAAARIKIDYEPLPGIFDPRQAFRDGAPQIHENGNIFLQTHVQSGDVDVAFKEADLIVERDYHTPVQFPVYLELEGGVAEYREGFLTIWCGSQYPTQDQRQLSQILNIPMEKIRVISNPVGGAFGGKDDLTIQPQLAVMAFKVGRPVKLVNTREESNRTSWKRHPMFITMKTAVKSDGTLLANKINLILDTGAYAGLGGAVMTNIIGHSCGAYRFPNLEAIGYCVYTNNCPNSAMRGFGIPQITFAMETQIDVVAEKLGLDPLEIRLKNGFATGDKGPFDNTLSMAMGTIPTLLKAEKTDLWKRRAEIKRQATRPWKRRGIGIATSIKGAGLGRGLPDYSAAVIRLNETGSYSVGVGCPDLGQGNQTAFAQIAAESLQCHIDDIDIITGDSMETPDSGITAASRTIYAAGNAILLAAAQLQQEIKSFASKCLNVAENEVCWDGDKVFCQSRMIPRADLAAMANDEGLILMSRSYFDMPVADRGVDGLVGLPHILFGATTQIALVEVDINTGYVDVLETICIPDAGKVINLKGLEGQAEGGSVMGMSFALMEDGRVRDGHVFTDNYDTYIIPTAVDCPEIIVDPVEVLEESGPFGAKGIAESLCTTVTPAVTNAIYDAIGVRISGLPATPEKIYRQLRQMTEGDAVHDTNEY